MQILSSIARKRYITALSPVDWGGKPAIRWLTRGTDTPSEISALSIVELQEGKVHHIRLSLDAGLTAQEVVAKWGEPRKVYVYRDSDKHRPHVWVVLCYPEQGSEFDVLLRASLDPTVFSPDDKVPWITLYAPMPEEGWLGDPSDPTEPWRCGPSDVRKAVDWPGFGPISKDLLIR